MRRKSSFLLVLAAICLTLVVVLAALAQKNLRAAKAAPRKAPSLAAKHLVRGWRSAEAVPSPVVNSVRIFNDSDSATDRRPISISRFFAVGEFPAPQSIAASIDGVPVATQVDVRTHWQDGSIQHAVLSFPVSIPAQGSTEVSFVPQEPPAADGFLDAEAMLSDAYNLGARITLATTAETSSVDVRELIKAGHFRYWLKGPICTQIIVEDRGADPAFDIAFNGHKSFHPIFVLTFFPGQSSVRVEFIGENAWLTRLQDLTYSLSLRVGKDPEAEPVFQKPDYTHIAGARWRKVFWSGPELPPLRVDYNLPYLIHSRALPNFNLGLTLSAKGMKDTLDEFKRSDQGELGGHGMWQKYLPSSGGRAELGIFPSWQVRYLYTFDPRLEQVSTANSEVSAYLPIHFRESAQDRNYSPLVADTPALGRAVSLDARPGFCVREKFRFSRPADKVAPVGNMTDGGWVVDCAHQGSFAYISYLLSGDWFFLEEMYFWSAFDLAWPTPGACNYCAGGPSEQLEESYAICHPCENHRAFAWVIRTLAHTALMAPDDSPEKVYFTDKLLNNIAAHEGRFNITDGLLQFDPSRQRIWDFGRNVYERGLDNPLALWCVPEVANVNQGDTISDRAKTYANSSVWMTHLILASLGHVEELGFPIQPLRRRAFGFMLGELTSPEYNRYLIDGVHAPLGPSQFQIFTTWAQIMDAYLPTYRDKQSLTYVGDPEFGYAFIALGAAAYLTDVDAGDAKGLDAWRWLNSAVPKQEQLNDNPKWAFVPRSISAPGSISNPESWTRSFQSWRIGRQKSRR